MNTISANGFNPVSKYPVKLVFDEMEIVVTKPFSLPSEKPLEASLKDYFVAIFSEDIYAKMKEKYKG